MIQPLRAWHRRIVFALAAALPLVFSAGLAVRRPIAVERSTGPLEPDMLVYWSASQPRGTALPFGARLLGTAREAGPGGYLVYYSLAHQKIVRWEAKP